jgi:chemotaxis signal transduction protein
MLALRFQIGQERVALDIRRISEVVPRVPLVRSAGSPAWLAGTFVYRQSVVPVIDLHRLFAAEDCPAQLSSRIIVVPWSNPHRPQGWLGLLAVNVSEIREIQEPGHAASGAPLHEEPDLGPTTLDRGEILRVLDLDRLLPKPLEDRLAGVCSA